MSASDNHAESITLLEQLSDVSSFPAIAEVDQDFRDVSHRASKLAPGTLLWLLRRCQDEVTGKRAVRVATFHAPTMEFPVVLEDTLMVFRRHYHEVALRMNQAFGPSMDVNMIANLAVPGCPVFAVSNDDKERNGDFILIHVRETVHGYLAKGKHGWLFIPIEFKGKFAKNAGILPIFTTVSEISQENWSEEVKVIQCGMVYNPHIDMIYENDILKLIGGTVQNVDGISTLLFERNYSQRGKLGTIRVAADSKGEFQACGSPDDVFHEENMMELQEIDTRQFPVDLSYTSRHTGSKSYIIPLDDETLINESPMTVFGKCLFHATYISIHHNDSFRNPSISIEMIPEFTPMKVRVGCPMPVHVQDFQKPCKTVQALTQEHFGQLYKTVAAPLQPERNRLPTYPLPGRKGMTSPVARRRYHSNHTTGNREDFRYKEPSTIDRDRIDESPPILRRHNTATDKDVFNGRHYVTRIDSDVNVTRSTEDLTRIAGGRSHRRERPFPAPRLTVSSMSLSDRPIKESDYVTMKRIQKKKSPSTASQE